MTKISGYNRNLMGGRRPHKGISNMPLECINNLSKRVQFESLALARYMVRVGQMSQEHFEKAYNREK